MEKWQKDIINSNLVELIENTLCNTILISRLISTKILERCDIENLNLQRDGTGRAKLLYDILITRVGAFEALLDAFEETRQSGALAVLKQKRSCFPNCLQISVDENVVLGKGSSGTSILKGNFDKRDVAVKVLTLEASEIRKALKEVEFLRKLDLHDNIVRYFFAEKKENRVYIALELMELSLEDEIKMKNMNFDSVNVLKKITSGLTFLHSNKIIHRDLKPSKILLSKPDKVKLSGFGISKEIPDDASCASLSGTVGTTDWTAPEILVFKNLEASQSSFKMTFASDIFSLGCIFYFVLTNGRHPFGSPCERQYNILKYIPLKPNSTVDDKWMDIISKMISQSPKSRPLGQTIISHFSAMSTSFHKMPQATTNIVNTTSIHSFQFQENINILPPKAHRKVETSQKLKQLVHCIVHDEQTIFNLYTVGHPFVQILTSMSGPISLFRKSTILYDSYFTMMCLTETELEYFFNLLSPQKLYQMLLCCSQFNCLRLFRFIKYLLSCINNTVYRNYLLDKLSFSLTFNKYKTLIYVERCFILLSVAAQYSNVEMIQEIFRFFTDCFQYDLMITCKNVHLWVKTPLHWAIERVDIDMVTYLSDKFSLNNRLLLYYCVGDSYWKPQKTIDKRVEICKLLLKKCSKLINEAFYDEYGNKCGSPLLAEKVDLQLIKFLIMNGADDCATYNNETFVERVDKYVATLELIELCLFLRE